MARETRITVTLRGAEGDFVSGFVSTSLFEAYIELTEEQALKLHLQLCKRFGVPAGDVAKFECCPVDNNGGSDK